jgi:predicted O-methyltransferase YrrM
VTLAFCPELDEMYRSRRVTGQSGRVFDNLAALSSPNNLHVLRALMLARKPAATLEVGLSFGGSALTMAASHRDLGHTPAGQHVAIDPYQDVVWDDCALVTLDKAGVRDFVDVRRQLSSAALPALASEGRRFDLIYVDGSHLFEDVFVDAYFGFQLLSDEGIILFDDCPDAHVTKVLKFVESNWAGLAEPLDLSPFHPDGGSLRYKMARRMGRTQLRGYRRLVAGPRAWDSPLTNF